MPLSTLHLATYHFTKLMFVSFLPLVIRNWPPPAVSETLISAVKPSLIPHFGSWLIGIAKGVEAAGA